MSSLPRPLLSLLLSPVLLAALGSCATKLPQDAIGTTFVIVRHAEKVTDGSRDPPLTASGRARAGALAAMLANASVEAVYATAFQRTQQTAKPTATTHALQVITYDSKQPAMQLAAQLKQAHPTGTVLVVGHSNTVPDLAAALCACDVSRMEENEYGRRMTIHVTPSGAASLKIAHDP